LKVVDNFSVNGPYERAQVCCAKEHIDKRKSSAPIRSFSKKKPEINCYPHDTWRIVIYIPFYNPEIDSTGSPRKVVHRAGLPEGGRQQQQ